MAGPASDFIISDVCCMHGCPQDFFQGVCKFIGVARIFSALDLVSRNDTL